jgi:anti-anti-sigma factor
MSSSDRPHLQVETVEGIAIVRLLDENIIQSFGERNDVDEIGEQLESLVEDVGFHRLLLNFEVVQYMASAMLAVLLRIQKKVAQHQGRLALCRFNPQVRDMVKITGLLREFAIYDDESSALDAFTSAERA